MSIVHEPAELLSAFSVYCEEDMHAADGSFPTGITINKKGNYIIVDNEQSIVKLFDCDGNFKKYIGQGQFQSAWDVFITNSGKIMVSDPQAGDFKVFSRHGKFLAISDMATHIKEPYGIAYELASGMMAVTDKGSCCVYLHNGHGVVQDILKVSDDHCQNINAPHIDFPSYTTFDTFGNILVSDVNAHCLYAFKKDGSLLWTYGSLGTNDEQLQHPSGICTDLDGNILLADSGNCRVHMLDPYGNFKDYILTWEDGIAEPQTMTVNSEGHLVVTEGTTGVLKVFNYLNPGVPSEID